MNSNPNPHADDFANREDAPQRPPAFPFVIFFFVWVLCVMMAALVTFTLPESFSSTARIKISQDQTDIPGVYEQPHRNCYDPYYIQTQLELIQSEIVLRGVIESLDLNTVWGKKYANGERLKTSECLQMLKGRMDLRPVKNTSLIEIRLFSEKPEEASKIANTVAEAYRDYRLNAWREKSSQGIAALETAYEQLNSEIQSSEAELAGLSHGQSAQYTNRMREAQSKLDQQRHYGEALFATLAAQKTNRLLPAAGMVEIVDSAVPGSRPVRPNKPLNIAVGIIVGMCAGLFLATAVYLLQRRAYRRAMGIGRTPYPPRFRAIVHIFIALVVGTIVGYNCATPLELSTMITVPVTILLGAVASAYIELANPGSVSVLSAEDKRSQHCKADLKH